MPTTLNGIGTRYCFKSNQVKRAGECTHCGRSGNLASYDAGLWFTVLFIPIVPLGRKRILDQCPLCTRHHVLDLDEWETSKQNAISGALQKYRANPTPEAGMAAYQQLLNFHQYEQAAELRQSLSERFAENATLQAYLGLTLQDMGKVDEAGRFFARALEINPDLPHARVGVANIHMRAGRLDDARRLLDFLEQPDAAQRYSLAPLENLAIAYQTAGQHRAALELLGLMRQALPEADQNRAFRKLVRKSEKALWHPNSMLGKKRFNWREFLGTQGRSLPGAGPTAGENARRTLLAFVIVIGLIATLVVTVSEYGRRHRELLVVNAYDRPATVTIPGAGSYPAPPGVSTIVLKEGTHHASITGPVRQEVDFELRSRYFYRTPAWVLNINGRALLALESVNYGRDAAPSGMSVHFGETFEYFLGVSYLFRPPPGTMQVRAGGTQTVLCLDFLRRPPLEVYQYLISRKDATTAARLAEWRLAAQPDDEEMLDMYVSAQEDKVYQARMEAFLRAGLTNRPVAMDWHRTYQMLRPDRQRDAQLATDYEAALRLDPTNSALLYLRGRLATGAERRSWFERARAADARNVHAWHALGYDHMVAGDWAGARELYAEVVKLQPARQSFQINFYLARLALHEYDALEQELRTSIGGQQLPIFDLTRLMDVLISQNRNEDAAKAIVELELKFRARDPQSANLIGGALRRYWLYATGQFAALAEEASNAMAKAPVAKLGLFHALLEQGRVEEALKISQPGGDEARPAFESLAVGLAWRLAGNVAEAEAWEARAARALESGDADDARAAALLRRPTPPAPAELAEVAVMPQWKSLLLADLAHRHPGRHAELGAAARRLNIMRSFPYHLVERAATKR